MREEERQKTYKKKQREKHRDREKQTQRKKQKGREDDLNSRFKNACLMMEKIMQRTVGTMSSRYLWIHMFLRTKAPCEPSMQSNILTTMPVIIVDLVDFFLVFSQRKCQ